MAVMRFLFAVILLSCGPIPIDRNAPTSSALSADAASAAKAWANFSLDGGRVSVNKSYNVDSMNLDPCCRGMEVVLTTPMADENYVILVDFDMEAFVTANPTTASSFVVSASVPNWDRFGYENLELGAATFTGYFAVFGD